MPDYTPGDVTLNMRCMAPIKRPGSNARTLADVIVHWVSTDGRVVEASTIPSRRSPRKLGVTFDVSKLRKPGSAA